MMASSSPLPPSCPRASPAHALGTEHRAELHFRTRNQEPHGTALRHLPGQPVFEAPTQCGEDRVLQGGRGPLGHLQPHPGPTPVPLCHLATAWGLVSLAGLGVGLTRTSALPAPSRLCQAQGQPGSNWHRPSAGAATGPGGHTVALRGPWPTGEGSRGQRRR